MYLNTYGGFSVVRTLINCLMYSLNSVGVHYAYSFDVNQGMKRWKKW